MAGLLATSVAGAQVVIGGGVGFITVSIAGMSGGGGGMAGDARLPVLTSNARYQVTSRLVTIAAISRRSVVKRIELEVPQAEAGQRIALGPNTGATIRIVLDGNRTLSAENGRGFVQFDVLTPTRGEGRYEGTFQNGPTPMVVRGTFQVNFDPSVGGPPRGGNPGPGPTPPSR